MATGSPEYRCPQWRRGWNFERNLWGKGAGIGGQKALQTGGNLGAYFAHIFLGRIFVEFVVGKGDVAIEGDDGPQLVAIRLLRGQLVERLVGAGQIGDGDVEKKLGVRRSAPQEGAAEAS